MNKFDQKDLIVDQMFMDRDVATLTTEFKSYLLTFTID